jgi:4-amino-4-deoxy-L-arabinose transferase-like glycosyltransferase
MLKVKDHSPLFIIVALICLVRLYCLQYPALLDPTEARYASMALKMVQSNQWLTPMIDRGDGYIPFWGKPPLHFWLTAASLKIFGFNEFAARLPSMIAGAGIILISWYVAMTLFGAAVAHMTALILIATPLFTIFHGVCIIDTTLAFFVTAALATFILFTIQNEAQKKSNFDLLFFISLAGGFMTKGPVCLVLVGLPLVLWCALQRTLAPLFRLRLIPGIIIFLILVVPWFLIAEQQSPGLIKYFFVNENFKRFISPDYEDLYGTAHRTFRAAIVPMLLVAFLPWILTWFYLKPTWHTSDKSNQRWFSLCILWGLSPVLFFAISNNVLVTYLLPGFAGLSITTAYIVCHTPQAHQIAKRLLYILSILAALGCLGLFIANKEFTFAPFIPIILLLLPAYLFRTELEKQHLLFRPVAQLFALTMLILIVLAPRLSDSLSTKTILTMVEKSGEHTSLMFRNKFPYSAQFYTYRDPTIQSQLQLLDNTSTPSTGILILKKSKKNSEINQHQDAISIENKNWKAFDLGNKQGQ